MNGMPATVAMPPGAAAPPSAAPPVAAFGPRLALGLLGVFVAAMTAGINSRVGTLTLPDIRGANGFGLDDGSWLATAYAAGEVIAMPLAGWFAVTLGLRRFHLLMLLAASGIASLLPFLRDIDLLLGMRFVQGMASGTMIPLLMMAALRFLPPSIRLYALALYAMTATFAPNVSTWLAGLWTDQWPALRMVYWQIVPANVAAAMLVAWGLPRDPVRPERFAQANWFGMAFGVVGLALLTVALDQGNRLEWLASPLIRASLLAGGLLVAFYLWTEWHHPSPFLKLQLLLRRNLGLGFSIFVCLLVVFLSGSLLPATHLGQAWGYRPLQSAPVGLMIGLPQLVIAPAVSLLLYRRWVDARAVLAVGLACVAVACGLGAHLTSQWMWAEFALAQGLQAVGQPMAVVAMLFLATSVVGPMEGPFVAGIVNLLRALGSLVGSALVLRVVELRSRFHKEMLLDHAARAQAPAPPDLAAAIAGQSAVLSVADAYLLLAVLAVALIPLAFALQYIPSPRKAAAS